jgi:enoyl-CoA hydratase/carnithine racemase
MSAPASVRTTLGGDGVARVTFDQPDSRANVLSRRVWDDLGAAVAEVAKREPKAVILDSAKPNIFLAGADLREIAGLPLDDPEPTREMVRRGLGVLAALEALPVPTVAVIDGACLGGGLEIALACDYRTVSDNPKAKLGLPEVKLALIPGWGGTQRLPRVIPPNEAIALVCSGEPVGADAARRCGLADVIDLAALPGDWRERRARKAAACASPTVDPDVGSLPEDESVAAAVARDVVRLGCGLPLAEAIGVETEAFVARVASPAARAKIAAFLRR